MLNKGISEQMFQDYLMIRDLIRTHPGIDVDKTKSVLDALSGLYDGWKLAGEQLTKEPLKRKAVLMNDFTSASEVQLFCERGDVEIISIIYTHGKVYEIFHTQKTTTICN